MSYPELEDDYARREGSGAKRIGSTLCIIAGLAALAYGVSRGYDAWRLRNASFEELTDKARSCAGKGDVHCAVEYWRAATVRNPGDAGAMANLAINLTGAGAHAEAIGAYEQSLTLGAAAYDLFAHFGRSLRRVGRDDDAISQFYRALDVAPQLRDITKETGEVLIQRGRQVEALALFGAFDAAQPEGRGAFRAQRLLLTETVEKAGRTGLTALTVPKIDGHFRLPARMPGQKAYESFVVDTGATHTVIPLSWTKDSDLLVKGSEADTRIQLADGTYRAAKRATARVFDVAGLRLENVSLLMCEGCEPLLGQSTLEFFDLSTARRDGLAFLSVKPRPR